MRPGWPLLRTSLFALVVALLFTALTTASVNAAGTTPRVKAAVSGNFVLVSGRSFPANSSIFVRAIAAGGEEHQAIAANSSGRFAVRFDIPIAFHGRVTIWAVARNASGRTDLTIGAVATPTTAATQAPASLATTFYVVPDNPAGKAAAADPTNAAAFNEIASRPTAMWLTEQTDLSQLSTYQADATSKGTVPVFVLYAIPGRDCGKFSAGGFPDDASYRNFVDNVKAGINGRKAVVILEPDALPELGVCGLSAAQQDQRVSLIKYGAQSLGGANISVYLEGGGAYSNPVSTISPRLISAGISYATGFALNVSAFDSTASELAYGHQLSAALGGKHFVVDTSRNGVGVPAGTQPGAFCNVAGLALGHTPTAVTGDPLTDAFLWIKYPGESDGDCGNGAPYSGVFFPSYALGLVHRSQL